MRIAIPDIIDVQALPLSATPVCWKLAPDANVCGATNPAQKNYRNDHSNGLQSRTTKHIQNARQSKRILTRVLRRGTPVNVLQPAFSRIY
jgi:hypothetical protein